MDRTETINRIISDIDSIASHLARLALSGAKEGEVCRPSAIVDACFELERAKTILCNSNKDEH